MKKKNESNPYFSAFISMSDCTVRAATELDRLMSNYRAEDLQAAVKPLHAVEHESDEILHETMTSLIHEFITPIEREDITDILNLLDTTVDDIEDVAIKANMFNVKAIRPECVQLCEIIVKCACALKAAAAEFPNFKKSKTLRPLLIDINSYEEEADRVYFDAMYRLYRDNIPPLEVTVWAQMFDALERCADDCEHAAYGIECAVLKNT